MKRSLVLVAAVLCVAWLAPATARSQDVYEWAVRGSATLGQPGLLLVIDSLEQQLATAGGRRTLKLVLDAELLNPNGLAVGGWAQLSAALDAGPLEAIHRLLGRRVVVAFSSFGLPMPGDWFIATEVSREDANRVLKGLDAVHRGVLAGATVFSIERGTYQMCVLKQNGDTRLLVLGPGTGDGLFSAAVRGLQDPHGRAWFASDWPVAEAGGMLLHVESGGESSLLYGRTTDTGWSGVAIARSELPDDAPTWAENIETMIDGVPLGMVGSLNSRSVADSPLAPFLGLNHNATRSVLGDASRRGILLVRTDPAGKASVVVGVETEPDRAREIDAAMRMLLAVVTGRPAEAPDFGGRLPGAARSVPLSGGFSERLGQLVLGEAPRIQWQMAPDRKASGLLAASLGSRSLRNDWLDAAMFGLAHAENGPLVSAGRLEPGPIAGLVERAAGINRPVLEWTAGIDAITWRTRRLGEDRVKATFEIALRGDK